MLVCNLPLCLQSSLDFSIHNRLFGNGLSSLFLCLMETKPLFVCLHLFEETLGHNAPNTEGCSSKFRKEVTQANK